MKTLQYIAMGALLVLCGCLGRPGDGREPATKFEREIDAGLDGIEHKLRRLQTEDSSQRVPSETAERLRRHRDELRRELDRLAENESFASDSVEAELRRKLEDLAVRYETARLGRFESRELFEQAAEARFEDLDRELALLEGQVFQGDLHDQFDSTIARLYGMRNDVALRIAETVNASEEDFPRFKSELAAAIGKLDLLLAHTTIAVDRAFADKYPIRTIGRLWL